MDMISCWKLLSVRTFVLEVWLWSGNDVPVPLYQVNVMLCPEQKGQSPNAQLSLSKVPALHQEEADLSWQLLQGHVPTSSPAVIP